MLGGAFVRETTIQLHTTNMEDHLDKALAVVPILWSRAGGARVRENLMGLVLERDRDVYRRIGFLEATSFSDPMTLAVLAGASGLPSKIQIV